MTTNGLFLALTGLTFIVWTEICLAQQTKVPQELWEKAQTEGVVTVIVHLNVPWQPEGKLRKEAAIAQRKAIAAAQEQLNTELAGTKHKVRRQFQAIPGIALEVGPDALAVLEHSVRVLNVTEDRIGGAH